MADKAAQWRMLVSSARTLSSRPESEAFLRQPFGVVDVASTDAYGGASDQAVVLRHVNLLIPAVPGVLPRIADWRFKTTPTVLDNLVRVCTAAAAGFPLLMTGPPGVGKTAIVKGINGVLGQQVERINFSSTTTVDSLVGSYMPVMVGGERTFQWRNGVLLSALENNKWVLFDEINLAPPEVLEEIAPLLTALFRRASGGGQVNVRFRQSGSRPIPITPQVQVRACCAACGVLVGTVILLNV